MPNNGGLHILIWESTRVLTDAPHTLVVTKTASDDVDGQSLLIDFFVYVPTDRSEAGKITKWFVDDSDPGVVYGDHGGGRGWETQTQDNNDVTSPTNDTLTSATGQGSVMSYSFLGTGISRHGILQSSIHGAPTLNLNVTIDDQSAQQFQPGLPSDLEYGNHTVSYTVKVVNTNEILGFDYFLVMAGVSSPSSSVPAPSGSSGSEDSVDTGQSLSVGAIYIRMIQYRLLNHFRTQFPRLHLFHLVPLAVIHLQSQDEKDEKDAGFWYQANSFASYNIL
ncbi:hypothetical protein D9758_010601 [Tetrapyrgos nigripes]|uniref:Uncharacterized protein n=1 Tax=Tetrapyrgos nigripes TaxID=182062 RepID=A0A8H5D571_9AGAR|nr:hypothetical protein D9758_010601 [Tetrapyrgos nigripes]